MTRSRLPRLLLILLLVAMPLLELFVLIQVGQVIGAGWTIALLVAASILGGWLIRREGVKAWQALTTSVESGRLPTTELADAALIVLAGALMLSPGFVTDFFALLLIFPLTRPLARALLAAAVAKRVTVRMASPMGFTSPANAQRPGSPTNGQVIQGEVVDP